MIDFAQADITWKENTEQWRVDAAKGNKSDPDDHEDEGAVQKRTATYSEARASREAYNAALAKLEFQQKSKLLVRADSIEKPLAEANRAVREAILSVPDRIAGLLCSITDPNEMHSVLTLELHKTLENLVADNRWRPISQ